MATGWASSTALAQWTTQTVQLKAGWSAIYLHVDASHVTIDQMMNADPALGVQEIWRWAPPASTLQFVTSPQTPLA